MQLRWTILFVAIVPLLFASLGVAWMVNQRSRTLAELHLQAVEPVLLAVRKAELQRHVNLARSAIAHLVRDGVPLPQAQPEALSILQRLEFGHDGGFFVFDFEGRQLVQPRRSQPLPPFTEDGADTDFPLQQLLQQARSGGGYVEYGWLRPSTGRVERKVAYVEPITGWEWVMGTGVFLDETAQARRRVEEATAEAVADTLGRVGAIAILGLLLAVASSVLVSWADQEKADAKLRAMAGQVVVGQEAERARVARELHDSVCQWLVSVKFTFESLLERARRAGTDPGLADGLQQGVGQLRAVLGEVRRISHDLRPALLDDLGLSRALQQLAEEWSARSGVPAVVDCAAADDVPETQATALYRVAQEALGNIERHAAARGIELRLTRPAGGVRLTITDDGVGFDVPAVLMSPRDGLGLTHMRERVQTLRGRFSIESSSRGTQVEAWFPRKAFD